MPNTENLNDERLARRMLLTCPRCADRGYEALQSHSHCIGCLYDTDDRYPNEAPQIFASVIESLKE